MTKFTLSYIATALILTVSACNSGTETEAGSIPDFDSAVSSEPDGSEAPETTMQGAVGGWSAESNPEDYSSPAQIVELTGKPLADVEAQVRAQGWTEVTAFTEEDFAAQDFDGDFRAWRMTLVYSDQDELVLQALVG